MDVVFVKLLEMLTQHTVLYNEFLLIFVKTLEFHISALQQKKQERCFLSNFKTFD